MSVFVFVVALIFFYIWTIVGRGPPLRSPRARGLASRPARDSRPSLCVPCAATVGTYRREPGGVMLPQMRAGRTRRNFADCTVVIEELWRKALDFASLMHSSVSFNGDKPETAAYRWARARTRVAKVPRAALQQFFRRSAPRDGLN
jgi:hypothetical protein